MASRVDGDFFWTGNHTFLSLLSTGGTLADAAIAANAKIAQTKLQHQHRKMYSQPNAAAVTETKVIYECYGQTGTVLNVQAGVIVAAIGAATVTIDVRKNGTTILSAVITIDNTVAPYLTKTGTVSVPGLVAGDVLSVVAVATAGGGTLPTGVFATVTLAEDAQ